MLHRFIFSLLILIVSSPLNSQAQESGFIELTITTAKIFGDEIAKGLKISIGDKLKFNILGRNFEARVFNTREIEWENMNINFIFILSKSNIENAPHTWIATTKSKNKIENKLKKIFEEKLTKLYK